VTGENDPLSFCFSEHHIYSDRDTFESQLQTPEHISIFTLKASLKCKLFISMYSSALNFSHFPVPDMLKRVWVEAQQKGILGSHWDTKKVIILWITCLVWATFIIHNTVKKHFKSFILRWYVFSYIQSLFEVDYYLLLNAWTIFAILIKNNSITKRNCSIWAI